MSNDKNQQSPKGNAKSKLDRPGPLQNKDAAIKYHTHQVIFLVRGRNSDDGKHPIKGLLSYASLLSPIHEASKSDDPYADHYLILVEQKLQEIREYLELQVEELLEKASKVSPDIVMEPANSADPKTVSARFKSPYAFGAAYLMQQLDNYISNCFLLNNRYVISTQERHKRIDLACGKFRSLFASTINFKAFGLTRADLELKTAIAKKAVEYYESLEPKVQLNSELLAREKRAEFAPEINPMLINRDMEENDLEVTDI